MARIDLHSKPFDDATLAKLEIFGSYAEAWLPTFVMGSAPEIHIFDFFGGTGFDLEGKAGSPIIFLQKIKTQIARIFQKKTSVNLHLNEFEPNKAEQEKFELLKSSCERFLDENMELRRAINIYYYNENFEDLFPKLLRKIRKYPSLVYLDQNGIKYLSDDYFLELEKCRQTDFLYFVSSSYFWRFGDHEAFKTHFNINYEEAKKDPYKFIHRNILKQLIKRLPINSKLKLYPYSLKKGANIHGIIFGATHARAVDKFLTIAWKRNELNGEANFDINEDMPTHQLPLFGKKPTKIEIFNELLKSKIIDKTLKTNSQVYHFCLSKGHICKHGSDCLKLLKEKGIIDYDGSWPLVTYDNVYKKNRILEYKIL